MRGVWNKLLFRLRILVLKVAQSPLTHTLNISTASLYPHIFRFFRTLLGMYNSDLHLLSVNCYSKPKQILFAAFYPRLLLVIIVVAYFANVEPTHMTYGLLFWGIIIPPPLLLTLNSRFLSVNKMPFWVLTCTTFTVSIFKVGLCGLILKCRFVMHIIILITATILKPISSYSLFHISLVDQVLDTEEYTNLHHNGNWTSLKTFCWACITIWHAPQLFRTLLSLHTVSVFVTPTPAVLLMSHF